MNRYKPQLWHLEEVQNHYQAQNLFLPLAASTVYLNSSLKNLQFYNTWYNKLKSIPNRPIVEDPNLLVKVQPNKTAEAGIYFLSTIKAIKATE